MGEKQFAKSANECSKIRHLNRKISNALNFVIKELGLFDGTVTVRARHGKLHRGIEIVSNVVMIADE